MTDPSIDTRGRRHNRPRPSARPGLRARAHDGRRAAATRLGGDVLRTSPLFNWAATP